jgi:hypothetical protein
MPRIAKADVLAALERAANHIRSAAGSDGITSRSDMRHKLRELQGIERLLTDVFYRFIDHRDAKAGARITEGDIAEAVSHARNQMIDQYDLNRNGLSASEVARMSSTGRMAVQLARQLKRAAQQEADLHPAELAEKLGDLVEGLWFDDFGSESSEALEPYFHDIRLGALTEHSFSQALDLNPADPREVIERMLPAGGFLERFVDIQIPDRQSQAIELIEVLRAHLYDLSVIILGEDDPGMDPAHPAYLVGLTRKGVIVGLKSKVVWT